MTDQFKSFLRRATVLFLVWTVLGLFMFSQGLVQKVVTNDPTPWWHHLTSWMVGVWLWFLCHPGVLWLGRRFPLERQPLDPQDGNPPGFERGSFDCSACRARAAILHSLTLFPALMPTFAATLAFLLIVGFHQGILTYWILLAIQYAVRLVSPV